MEATLIKSAVDGGVLPPSDTLERVDQLLKLETIAKKVIDRWRDSTDEETQTKKRKVE